MGQIWNRIKKIAQAYTRDTTSWSYESVEEEDQRRLKEIIDQLNSQGPSQRNETGNGAAGRTGNAHRSSGGNRQQQQPRSGTQTPEAALAVLGLPAGATGEEVRRAYKRLMLRYHPDRVASLGAAEQEASHRRAQEINAAYQVLKARYNL